MKTTIICITLFGTLISCGTKEQRKHEPSSPTVSPKPKPKPPVETPIPKEEPKKDLSQDIQAFFAKSVEQISKGNTVGEFTNSSPLTVSDLATETEKIWQAWVLANNASGEEALGEPQDKNTPYESRWKLPNERVPEASTEVWVPATMPYYYLTKGEQPKDGYPLYLYLHGSGRKNSEWSTGLRLAQTFQDSPSAYFVPQIPNEGGLYRWWQKSKQFAWEKLLRTAFVSGKIDPKKVYFFGISEGGYGSQRLASYYADYLAGAGPMAGGEPLINAPVENCKNIAFTLRTGAEDKGFDRDVLTRYTREAFEQARAEAPGAFEHWIDLIPDNGHSIDYYPTTPWLSKYSRNPYPKQVNWEDMELDGRHRSGFYNLTVLTRPQDARRVYYKMDIQVNNQINLQINFITYQGIEQSPTYGFTRKYSKTYTPATGGKLRIYLNEHLIDLSKPIKVLVNGRLSFEGKLSPDVKHIVNSCATYFDPLRLYPTTVDISY